VIFNASYCSQFKDTAPTVPVTTAAAAAAAAAAIPLIQTYFNGEQ